MIDTLIIDDTAIYRKIMSQVVSLFPELNVVGTASNGSIALKKMAQMKVDFVLCDIHMPEMDGVETLIQIKKRYPAVQVVMVSGISDRQASLTIQALQSGAIDFIRKPEGNNFEFNIEKLRKDLEPVLVTVKTKFQLQNPYEKRPTFVSTPKIVLSKKRVVAELPDSLGVVVIGVSTGGPETLQKFIPKFSKDFPLPILIVQHMPPMFTKSLADSLNRYSELTVVEVSEGEEIKKGFVYIAPGGMHLVVRKENDKVVAGYSSAPPENSCRPSVDVLFRSVANVYADKGIMSIILTGMGQDGLNGVRTLKRKKCFSITQSSDSCVIYGMPRAVEEAGLSDMVLPLEKMINEINVFIKKVRIA